MKIMDLFNKIANGEEIPKKIKYGNMIFEYNEKNANYVMIDDDTQYFLDWVALTIDGLNDEVEIIEEKKIPEKLNLDNDELRGKETPRAIDYLIEDKINKLIDYLESKEKGE